MNEQEAKEEIKINKKAQKKYNATKLKRREHAISVNNPLNDKIENYISSGGKFSTLVTQLLEEYFDNQQ